MQLTSCKEKHCHGLSVPTNFTHIILYMCTMYKVHVRTLTNDAVLHTATTLSLVLTHTLTLTCNACTDLTLWMWNSKHLLIHTHLPPRSTPCPNVKLNDEWGDPTHCEQGDSCCYCHTRTEQQFHPEVRVHTQSQYSVPYCGV